MSTSGPGPFDPFSAEGRANPDAAAFRAARVARGKTRSSADWFAQRAQRAANVAKPIVPKFGRPVPTEANMTHIEQARSLEGIEAQIEALGRLEEQAKQTFSAQMQLQGLSTRATEEGTQKIEELYNAQREAARQEARLQARIPYPGAPSRASAASGPAGVMGGFGPPRPFAANTNMTQEDIYFQQRQAQGDDNPFYPSSENMRLRDVAKGVLHGNLRPSQALLAPGTLLFDALRQGRLNPEYDPATGALLKSRHRGAFFGGTAGRMVAGGALGVGGLFAASQALPYALEGVERVYNDFAGGDIAYGQAAGLRGNQGASAFGTGIVNRAIEPINLIGGAFGMPNIPFIGSPAAQFGSERRLEAFRAGFNPFDALSIREAEGIQREVLNRGYRAGSQQEEDIISGLYRLKNTTGADPGQALDYIDVMSKKFNISVEDVISDLENFAEASQAAGKSVDEFTKEVSNNTMRMTEMGVDARTASNLSQAFASVQGVPGEAVAGVANAQNPFFTMMAMQTNPEIFQDPAKLALFMQDPTLAMGGDTAGGVAGTIRQQMDMITQIYPSAADMTLEQRAALLKQFNIPGLENLSARQIADLYENGGDIESNMARQTAYDPLQKAYQAFQAPSAFDFNPESRELREKQGVELDKLYDAYMKTVYAENDLTDEQRNEIRDMVEKRANPADIQAQVDRYLGVSRGEQGDAKEDASNRLLIEASPELQKFFRFVEQEGNANYNSGTQARTSADRNRPRYNDRTSPFGNYKGFGG
jgi:hypothetical protein